MIKQSCLIVVFNHRYDKNLTRIKELYKDKFDDIYILMPFYDGEAIDGLNIIPVYDSSYEFNGYIAQAFLHIKKNCSYVHYVIIGDDLILNPNINQNNVAEKLRLDSSTSYIKTLTPLSEIPGMISKRLYQDMIGPFYFYNGTEWQKVLCNPQEAFSLDRNYNRTLADFRLTTLTKWMWEQIIKGNVSLKLFITRSKYYLPTFFLLYAPRFLRFGHFHMPREWKKGIPYPLYKDYCDFLVLAGKDIEKLVQYFGVLAAMQMFVEVAIPTAMKLVCTKTMLEEDIPYKGVEYWTKKEIDSFYNKYNGSLNKLFDEWGDNVLYYHPVKLSKWT